MLLTNVVIVIGFFFIPKLGCLAEEINEEQITDEVTPVHSLNSTDGMIIKIAVVVDINSSIITNEADLKSVIEESNTISSRAANLHIQVIHVSYMDMNPERINGAGLLQYARQVSENITKIGVGYDYCFLLHSEDYANALFRKNTSCSNNALA